MGKREAPVPGGAPGPDDQVWSDMASRLDAWAPLKPDPAAMEAVAGRMTAIMAASRQPRASGDAVFRTVTAVWAVIGLAGYLVWPYLTDWYTTHAFWVVLGVSSGVAGLLMPLVIMLLHRSPSPQFTRTQ